MEDLPQCWLKLARRPNDNPIGNYSYGANDIMLKAEIESHYTLKTAPYSSYFYYYIFCCEHNDESCDSLLNELYCISQTDLLDAIFPGYKKLPYKLQSKFCDLIYNLTLFYGGAYIIRVEDDLWIEFLEMNFVFSEPLKIGKKYRLFGSYQSLHDLVLSRLHDKNRDIFLDLEF
ncbi:MAG TPA: hypothetical protein VI821_00375 [Candidatus Paceibacterota bacterium]